MGVGAVAIIPGYVIERLLTIIPVALGVTFLSFALVNLLPGDAAEALLGPDATSAQMQALAVKLHLNEPFFERYAHWLGGIATGNLGTSLASGQQVSSIIAQRIPVTFELAAVALFLALGLAVPIAVLAARRPGGVVDRIVLMASVTSVSVTPFVLAVVLVLVFAVHLGWFPAVGFVPIGQSVAGNIRSLVLPAVVTALPLFGGYTRVLRTDLVDQLLGEDYVLTARTEGASPWQVLFRHALRNSTLGLVTLVGLNVGTLISATVIVEQVFDLPGLGSALLEGVNDRDVPVVGAIALIFALSVVAANLVTDLSYSVLDPRIRHGRSER
jgi:peptide/nickel transport system permease protein